MTSSGKKLSSLALAAAAAIAFTAAPVATSLADDAKVACEGVNKCKGQGSCATSKNSCAGKNECKGQGVVQMTQAECDAAKAKAKKS
jgi:hypothetical protein